LSLFLADLPGHIARIKNGANDDANGNKGDKGPPIQKRLDHEPNLENFQ
jgi:hypothetical protein